MYPQVVSSLLPIQSGNPWKHSPKSHKHPLSRQLVPYHPAEVRRWEEVATRASGNANQQQLSHQGPKSQTDENKSMFVPRGW